MDNPGRRTDDDLISFCGSVSGEGFSTMRRRDPCTLRQHSVASLSRQLQVKQYEKSSVACQSIDDANLKPKPKFNNSFHGYRFIVTIIGGLSVGLMFLFRYNITISMLKMVNQTAIYLMENPNATQEDIEAHEFHEGGEFVWNNEIQQMVMSLYMLAYTICQMPSMRLAMYIGTRWSTPIALIICAISSLLTPAVAHWGWRWVVALRLLNGLGAGPIIPIALGLVEKWMPRDKITLGLSVFSLTHSTMQALIPILIGFLSDIDWRYSFYTPAVITLIFSVIWVILVTDRPDENWLTSERELEIICNCSQSDSCQGDVNKQGGKTKEPISGEDDQEPTPGIIDILKVPQLYFYLLIWCSYCSIVSVFLFTLPTYLSQFLQIHVSQIGLLCSMIMSGTLISMLWPHPVMRFIKEKFKLSQTNTHRILFLLISLMGSATWFFIASFHTTQIPVFFINRCVLPSQEIVVIGSIMSNYAPAGLTSLAYSIINTVGNLSVVFSSTFAGWLLDYTGQSVWGWSLIYYGLFAVQLVTIVIFCCCVDAEPVNFKKNKSRSDIEANQPTAKGLEATKQDNLRMANPGIRDIRSVSCYSQQSG